MSWCVCVRLSFIVQAECCLCLAQRDHPEAVLIYRTTSSGPKEGVPQLRISKQRAAQECALLPHPTLLLPGKQAAAYSSRRRLLHLGELPGAEHICLPRADRHRTPGDCCCFNRSSSSLKPQAIFPQLNPFTKVGQCYIMVIWQYIFMRTLPASQLLVPKTCVVLLDLLWHLSDSVSSSVE